MIEVSETIGVGRCAGMVDLTSEDMALFRHIERTFLACCTQRGYEEIRTPTIEYLDLFTSAGILTAEKLHELYSFLDWDGWSGERVVLRPDGTVPSARVYAEMFKGSGIRKLCYVENMFRFQVEEGESREFWQCGAEVIGAAEPHADVELIVLAKDVLRSLGVPELQLCLSHAGLVRSLLKEREWDLSEEEQERAFDAIQDGHLDALPSDLRGILSLRGETSGFVRNLKARFPDDSELGANVDNLLSVTELLSALNYRYEVNFGLSRGFEYYTGIMFELTSGGRFVGGGGRYDELMSTIAGIATPGCGFALSIQPLISLLRFEAGQGEREVVLVRMEDGTGAARTRAFELASELREAGCPAEVDVGYDPEEIRARRWGVSVKEGCVLLADHREGTTRSVACAAEIVRYVGHTG